MIQRKLKTSMSIDIKEIMRYFIVITLVLLSLGCSKERVSCSLLEEGILTDNSSLIEKDMNDFLAEYDPSPESDDQIGHRENLQKLVDNINNCDYTGAEIVCYACIRTNPPQSEVAVTTIGYDDGSVTKVIDIKTPDDGKMEFVRVH